ncbi:hypothetical protein [Streptomyces fulvoviolaceus]|uniref:hypothetical protein n=1 Tax=Streptomyces fulvoviolaceus TaxID=285535 RepID=UPI000AB80601|nr:hypothetical protein [Streptomyces fulvoviolaceus]MCT9078712.1 hypothetical protein [Streptomyces fulvoviolaceus]
MQDAARIYNSSPYRQDSVIGGPGIRITAFGITGRDHPLKAAVGEGMIHIKRGLATAAVAVAVI